VSVAGKAGAGVGQFSYSTDKVCLRKPIQQVCLVEAVHFAEIDEA